MEEKPAKLERAVYFSALSEETVQKLQKLADEKAIETLTLLNKEALTLKQSQDNAQDTNHRIRFGCYWYDNVPAGKEEDEA
jgi:hypothetical protein